MLKVIVYLVYKFSKKSKFGFFFKFFFQNFQFFFSFLLFLGHLGSIHQATFFYLTPPHFFGGAPYILIYLSFISMLPPRGVAPGGCRPPGSFIYMLPPGVSPPRGSPVYIGIFGTTQVFYPPLGEVHTPSLNQLYFSVMFFLFFYYQHFTQLI